MKVQFKISTDHIIEFADIPGERDIDNQITGSTEERNLLINVAYSRDDPMI